MPNMTAQMHARRSVRTFDGRTLAPQHLQALTDLMAHIGNPYGLPTHFKLLDAAAQRLSCPVVVGTCLYVGLKMQPDPHMNEAAGYSFETLILHAQALGVGTVWIGGTMDRPAFENAMGLAEGEVMPCVSPLGYPAEKMSLRESMMRKTIKADERLPFSALFFEGSFARPLTPAAAGALAAPLEAVRCAPSAVNRQPWRIVLANGAAHFYLARSKGFAGGTLDMQKVDMGIALCHFELAAREAGFTPRFALADPGIDPQGLEYIATYQL